MVKVELCVHIRLMETFSVMSAPYTRCAEWKCLRKEIQLAFLPHAGDAVAVDGIESPRSVDYVIFQELPPFTNGDGNLPLPVVKLRHEDSRSRAGESWYVDRVNEFVRLGWTITSEGRE